MMSISQNEIERTSDETKKEELSLLTNFYNESIKELQQKVKTCEIIKDNHERLTNEILQLNDNNKNYIR